VVWLSRFVSVSGDGEDARHDAITRLHGHMEALPSGEAVLPCELLAVGESDALGCWGAGTQEKEEEGAHGFYAATLTAMRMPPFKALQRLSISSVGSAPGYLLFTSDLPKAVGPMKSARLAKPTNW
jgi:hypothetical protein